MSLTVKNACTHDPRKVSVRCGPCTDETIDALRAEVDELRNDAARLDFFDKTKTESCNYLVRQIAGDPKNPCGIEIQPHYPQHDVSFGFRTIREAIDSAMEASP